MSQRLMLGWLRQLWTGGLSGGQAPAYWQRQLALSTAKLKAFKQACAWLAQTSEVAINLHEGPLLGHCLTDLTGAIAQATESPLEVSRFQPTQPKWSELGRDRQQGETAGNSTVSFPPQSPLQPSRNLETSLRNSRLNQQFPQMSAGERASRFKVDSAAEGGTAGQLISPKLPEGEAHNPPIELPLGVNRELLSRLASQTTAAQDRESLESRQTDTPLRLGPPPSGRSPAHQSPGDSNRDPSSRVAGCYAPPAPNSEDDPDWWTALARRVGQVLHQPLSQLSRENLPTLLPPPEKAEVLSLANQGKLTLDGPAVSQEWLSYWAGQTDFSWQVLPNNRSKSSELGTGSSPLRSPEAVQPSSPSHSRGFQTNNAELATGLSQLKGAGKSEAAAVEPWLRNQPESRSLIRDTPPGAFNTPGSESRFPTNFPRVSPTANPKVSVLQDNGFSHSERWRTGSVVPPNPLVPPTGGEELPASLPTDSASVREASVATALTTPIVESDRLPSLLSLLARREGNESPPVTSTAILRRVPRQVQPPTTEDDLQQLAAQIQRLLAEEARRHGIDV
jgi:hypothetical protein